MMEKDQGITNAIADSEPAVIVATPDKPESISSITSKNDESTPPAPVERISSDSKSNSNSNSLDKTNNQVNNAGKPGPQTDVQHNSVSKRVRFSICEYITETLVHESWTNGSHENPAFENEKDNMGNEKSDNNVGGNRGRLINGKLRRDSIHPLVGFQPQGNKPDSAWDIPQDDYETEEAPGESWSELSTKKKVFRVLTAVAKVIGLLTLLYFFVCSLDLLSLGFRLVGGSTAGDIFRQSSILQNPVVGVMIGILTTVLVQSSSTSTSIIVGMVAAGFMDVRIAIPPIMGANIGTSITNTIVSFTQAGDRNQFRRAFAGATILDMFNWITVIVLLPFEVLFGYLYHTSKATVDLIIPDSQSGGEIQLLSVITNPFVDLIVQLNDEVLECWATPNCTDADDASLILEFCSTTKTEITVQGRVVDLNGKEILNIRDVAVQNDPQKCDFLFAGTSMSDAAVGAIILVSSLIVLCFCLIMIVKLLSSVLEGHVSTIIKRTLNADIPYVPWITGYIAIFIGALMTFLVQSSSVFTSALTPLVGLGVISLPRVYPLMLGANIGTTTTAILASMAADGKALHPSLQIALCHFFFNITGVLLFYPVPFLRFPIGMSKSLGNRTAKYRWFAIVYLVSMFAVLPAVFILLSLAGPIYVIVLVSIVGVLLCIIAIMTIIQRKVPRILPEVLRSWKFLPEPLRSLRPYDKLLSKMQCCCSKQPENDEDDNDSDDDGYSGGRNVYRDNDFVFLTGNKIPPPNGYTSEDGLQQSSRPSITRIVPTRIIRNISNGNGDYGHVNGNGIIPGSNSNSDDDDSQTTITNTNGHVVTDSSSTPPNSGEKLQPDNPEVGINTSADNNSSTETLTSNTLPMPQFLEESPGADDDDNKENRSNYNNSSNNSNGRNLNSARNLQQSNSNGSPESFKV